LKAGSVRTKALLIEMQEEQIYINIEGEAAVDIDYTTDNYYVTITDKGNVITPYEKLEIEQSFDFPIIRTIDQEKFLVAGSRVKNPGDNCFIYDDKGNILNKFFAGDGIQDIEVVKGKIIVSFFDEGVYGMRGPNNGGLVVFDQQGKIEFNFNENHGGQIISDCYCLCKHGPNRVLFFPYDSWTLTELDIDNYEEKEYATPGVFAGSSALTSTKDSVIFHSPYSDQRALLKWTIENNKVEKIGEYTEGIRGLKNGKFLSKGEKGFTIIDIG